MTEQTKVHHMTIKKAERLEAEGRITDVALDAVKNGETTVEDALAYREQQDVGPDIPPKPKSGISKDDNLSPCLCGCGELVPRRFKVGHDQRLVTYAKQYVRGERELTPEQMEYVEESGKLDQARSKVAKEQEKAKKQSE